MCCIMTKTFSLKKESLSIQRKYAAEKGLTHFYRHPVYFVHILVPRCNQNLLKEAFPTHGTGGAGG